MWLLNRGWPCMDRWSFSMIFWPCFSQRVPSTVRTTSMKRSKTPPLSLGGNHGSLSSSTQFIVWELQGDVVARNRDAQRDIRWVISWRIQSDLEKFSGRSPIQFGRSLPDCHPIEEGDRQLQVPANSVPLHRYRLLARALALSTGMVFLHPSLRLSSFGLRMAHPYR